MTDLQAGTELGEYRVARKIGAGGMGAVYLAHGRDGSAVALKVMHGAAAQNAGLRKRFVREGRATQALDHPNVIRVLATFEHEGAPVLAMELLSGVSLEQHLEKKKTLAIDEAASIFLRVTSALGAAHALGLVHRDVKPENVFLTDAPPFVKVLDFGIAKIQRGGGLEETSSLTETGMLVGSPFYMSPEQAFGEKDIDHRSDIWAVGIILYRALTGTLVTQAATLKGIFEKLVKANFPRLDKVDPKIPSDLADLVDRMLRVNRGDRPADLREVYEVLSRHASAIPDAPRSFAEAAPTLLFDEASAPTDAGEQRTVVTSGAAGARGTASLTELKLTPQKLSAQAMGRVGGTSETELAANYAHLAPGPAGAGGERRGTEDVAVTAIRPQKLGSTVADAPSANLPPRGSATVLIENPMPRRSAAPVVDATIPLGPVSHGPASLDATTTDPAALSTTAPSGGAPWLWIVAALVVVGAIVFAITRLV